jgi:hypothetical protein
VGASRGAVYSHLGPANLGTEYISMTQISPGSVDDSIGAKSLFSTSGGSGVDSATRRANRSRFSRLEWLSFPNDEPRGIDFASARSAT